MSLTKSLFLSIVLLLPSIQAAPIVDIEFKYETVTIFEYVTAEIPTGILYGPKEPTATTEALAVSTPAVSYDEEEEYSYTSSNYEDDYTYESETYTLSTWTSSTVQTTSSTDDATITETSSSTKAATTTTSSISATSASTSSSVFDPTVTHTGVATYYSVGADNCGTSSTDTDYICAISKAMYDTLANSESISEYCGHKISITYSSTTIEVTVVDSCESCDADHLDLSPSAFSALANQELGEIDITWEWIS